MANNPSNGSALLITKAHYELIAQFDKEFSRLRLAKEPKEMWPKGVLYQDGRVNDLFLAFRKGHAYNLSDDVVQEDLAHRETWFEIEYSIIGADDWFATSSTVDTIESARQKLVEKVANSLGGFEYRIVLKTLTAEVVR